MDAFGNPDTSGPSANNFLAMDQPGPKEHLTGKMFDTTTGLYYFHARWYDPEVGRFVQRGSPYTFNENNPNNRANISGEGDANSVPKPTPAPDTIHSGCNSKCPNLTTSVLKNAKQHAINENMYMLHLIKNYSFKKCLKKKIPDLWIKCGAKSKVGNDAEASGICDGEGRNGGMTIFTKGDFFSDTCCGNTGTEKARLKKQLSDTLIHEAGHICGWFHGQEDVGKMPFDRERTPGIPKNWTPCDWWPEE